MTTPEEDPVLPDDLERLEELQQKTKEAQEAWRKLLENMGKLTTGKTEMNEPKKPNS